MNSDPLIDEVRRVRHKISAECGHDTKRLLERYQRMAAERRASGKYRYEGNDSRCTAIPLTEAEMLALNDKPDKKE